MTDERRKADSGFEHGSSLESDPGEEFAADQLLRYEGTLLDRQCRPLVLRYVFIW